jgi:dTDP-4-dehydrorhamnose 3,5-epimerase
MEPFIIKLQKHEDIRGCFYESYTNKLIPNDIVFNIVQENTCISNKNVIRGFHYQVGEQSQAKLLQVLNGEIHDILIDIRPGETYGKIYKFILSERNKELLYIPHGFAHGYSSRADNTIVNYKTDKIYNKESEQGFSPLSYGINWDIENPIISEKDKNLPMFLHSLLITSSGQQLHPSTI